MPYYAVLTSEEELRLAQQARAAERSARRLLTALDAGREALQRAASEKTEIERLQAALRACAAQDPARIAEARRQVETAEACYWKLALSGSFLLGREAHRFRASGMEREELAQYGYVGLLEAARRFEPARKLRFSTYARWWVRAQMQRALEVSGRLVRLPASAALERRRLLAADAALRARGEPADVDALAAVAGLSPRRARFLLRQEEVLSLDEPGEGDATLGETLADEDPRGGCEDRLIERELLERVSDMFGNALDEREQAILIRHYGLDGAAPASLGAIGLTLGLSRERIRQIEVLALQQIRLLL